MNQPTSLFRLRSVFSLAFIAFASMRSSLAIADDPQAESVKPALRIKYDVVYGNANEPMHRADIYSPAKMEPNQKLPAVLLIHGGAWAAGDKLHDTEHAKQLASNGVVVVAINYRLAPKHPYPAQIDDCRLALRWLTSHADELAVNVDQIGAWGYSAGGHLSAMLAMDPPENLPRIKACVSGAAPCDLREIPEDSRMLAGVFGGSRGQFPQRYADASPVIYATPDDPPMFLFHGAKDWLVPPNASELMKEALSKQGITMEHYVVPNKGHLMTFVDKEAMARSFAFLKRHLYEVK